jgi:hypothetical protein
MAFYGSNGALFADRIGFEIYADNDHIARRHENEAEPTPLHARNFIERVRSCRSPSRVSDRIAVHIAVSHVSYNLQMYSIHNDISVLVWPKGGL